MTVSSMSRRRLGGGLHAARVDREPRRAFLLMLLVVFVVFVVFVVVLWLLWLLLPCLPLPSLLPSLLSLSYLYLSVSLSTQPRSLLYQRFPIAKHCIQAPGLHPQFGNAPAPKSNRFNSNAFVSSTPGPGGTSRFQCHRAHTTRAGDRRLGVDRPSRPRYSRGTGLRACRPSSQNGTLSTSARMLPLLPHFSSLLSLLSYPCLTLSLFLVSAHTALQTRGGGELP